MKILYLSPIFETSLDPGSDRYFYFLKGLAANGHQVQVITSAVVYKEARLRADCRGRLWTKIPVEGIRAIYLWSYPNIRGSFARRLIYLVSFMALALLAGLFIERPDVIYSPNSPGMVGYAGYLLSWLRRIPLVFEVADVWPDAGIAMGTLANPWLIAFMQRMELACYRQASRITALTRGIKTNIEAKGQPKGKVALVTNGVAPELFLAADPVQARQLRAQFGLDNCLVATYLGAHGHYNSLWTIIEAARCLKDDDRFAFVLIGDGDYKARLEQMVQEASLRHVVFLPPVPRQKSPTYLALADVFLLPNRKGDFFKMNLPNKVFDFLMSGRPIVVAGEGETGDLVQQAEAGLVVPAEDAAGMARALQNLLDLGAAERRRMGEQGRAYVMRHYDRANQRQLLEQVLLSAAGRERVGR